MIRAYNYWKTAAKQFLARLSQEITRSLVTYKRLKKENLPVECFLPDAEPS